METFFLITFVAGLSFVVLSFVLGFADLDIPLPGDLDLDLDFLGGDDAGVSPLNVSTVAAFITWFGGVGYLLTSQTGLGTLAAVALSGLGGLVGGLIVFLVLARLILPGQTAPMRAEDYRIEGTLARVTMPIAPNGIGEIVYEKHGSRRSEGARSADGALVPRGSEVVVLRYERGIAYVEPLDKLLAERTASGRGEA